MPETNQNQQNLAEIAVERLVAAHSNEAMTPAEREEVRAWATRVVGDGINEVLLQALSDEQLEELDRRMEAGASQDEVEQFFLSAGVDYQPILEQALQQIVAQNGGQN